MTTTEPTRSGTLAEQVAELLAWTTKELQADERASGLISSLPALGGVPIRIALAGPHNAGKSMLIAALLGLPKDKVEEITDAVPLTDTITPYDWAGCTLLDLPGTQSGLDIHDAVAAAGLRQADLLLLVTSVELPGEEETQHIHHLLKGEGFAHRVLVVVNKCNSEDNDPDVVRAEMLDRLAPFPWIDPLFADARDYVDGRNADGLTDEDRELLREESRIDQVIVALSSLVRDHGQNARLLGVCHEVRRISVEASKRWVPSEEEEALELTADRTRRAIDDARRDLEDATDLAVETLGEQLGDIGNRLAGAVSEHDASVATTDATQAERDEATVNAEFQNLVNQTVDEVLGRLDEELGTSLEDWERYSADTRHIADKVEAGRARKKKSVFVDDAMDKAWRTGTDKLREKLDAFVEGGYREGGPAHTLAKRYKQFRGGSPAKSYEHQNRAKRYTRTGKGVQNIAELLGPLVDAKGTLDHAFRIRAVKSRQAEIRSLYAEHVYQRTEDERAAIGRFIESHLQRRHAQLSVLLEAADESTQARTTAQTGWRELEERAMALAAAIDVELSR